MADKEVKFDDSLNEEVENESITDSEELSSSHNDAESTTESSSDEQKQKDCADINSPEVQELMKKFMYGCEEEEYGFTRPEKKIKSTGMYKTNLAQELRARHIRKVMEDMEKSKIRTIKVRRKKLVKKEKEAKPIEEKVMKPQIETTTTEEAEEEAEPKETTTAEVDGEVEVKSKDESEGEGEKKEEGESEDEKEKTEDLPTKGKEEKLTPEEQSLLVLAQNEGEKTEGGDEKSEADEAETAEADEAAPTDEEEVTPEEEEGTGDTDISTTGVPTTTATTLPPEEEEEEEDEYEEITVVEDVPLKDNELAPAKPAPNFKELKLKAKPTLSSRFRYAYSRRPRSTRIYFKRKDDNERPPFSKSTRLYDSCYPPPSY